MKKPRIVLDLFGVITLEPYFATKIVHPLLHDRIDYNLFKKRYILYCVGLISHQEFWHGIAADHEIDGLEQRIYAATKPNDDIVDLIKDLTTSHTLVVASETPSRWGNALLEMFGIQNCFSQLLFSSDVGATKPFKGFYDHVFTTHDADLYIDDTLENLQAARDYGARLIWYGSQRGGRTDIACAASAAEVRSML